MYYRTIQQGDAAMATEMVGIRLDRLRSYFAEVAQAKAFQ